MTPRAGASESDVESRRAALLERRDALIAEKRRMLQARRAELLFERCLHWREPGSFAAFVKLTWPVVEPAPLEWAPYLDLVCDALHRQMLGDPDYQKLLLMLPPGYAKSLLVSVLAPAYEWLFHPARRKLFFSAGDNVARRDSRRTRILLQSEVYRQLLAEVCRREGREPWKFAGDQNTKDNFENSERGFRNCMTLRSGVTGNRGDDFVIDDPVQVKDVILSSAEVIERRCAEANLLIDQALESRVNDRRTARRTLIMQTLHPDDPSQRALREGGWYVVCLPLRYEPDHPQACPDDPRTEPGEFLHPTRDREADVAALERKLGAAQAAAQLQQRPVPAGGGRIQRAWFGERYACRPEDLAATADEVWVSSDAARKSSATSDYHAIQVWARKGTRRYLLDRVTDRMGYPEYEQAMDAVLARWCHYITRTGTGGALIEDTANGTTYLQVRGPSHLGVNLIGFDPTRDTPGKDHGKGARAVYLERAGESGAIVLPSGEVAPWVEDLLTWWCAFPLGKHDDDVDAASQLLMRWTLADAEPTDRPELGWTRLVAMGGRR